MSTHPSLTQMRRIRLCMWCIITGLTLSGITAFPLQTELDFLNRHATAMPVPMQQWLGLIYNAIKNTNQSYPYLSYGTDWLAFAHLILALLFVGPLTDPVKNIWVIEFGIMASLLIFPLAFVVGYIRHIPLFWRLIDCSFGVIAIIPLTVAYYILKRSEKTTSTL